MWCRQLVRSIAFATRSTAPRKNFNAFSTAIDHDKMNSEVSKFIAHHFRHFNGAVLVDAANEYHKFIQNGGKMFLSMAGAMSTAEIGRSLAQMIRAGNVSGLSVTGANLEEDLFNLVAHNSYERIPDFRSISKEEEQELYDRGMNRVTDTCIPEDAAIRRIDGELNEIFQDLAAKGERVAPHELFYRIIREGKLESIYEADPENSWLIAAAEKDLPIVTPGWEDSSCGCIAVARKLEGNFEGYYPIKHGLEQMEDLCDWYAETQVDNDVGFFQIGGGIAGDFSIAAVPLLRQDMGRRDIKLWSYFCQISDGTTSYGGYSAAPPNEKITWGKLSTETPSFIVESDATIVWPLMCAHILAQQQS